MQCRAPPQDYRQALRAASDHASRKHTMMIGPGGASERREVGGPAIEQRVPSDRFLCALSRLSQDVDGGLHRSIRHAHYPEISGDCRQGIPVRVCQGYLNRDKERTVRVRIAGRGAYLTMGSTR
jgi:hypothetical protein